MERYRNFWLLTARYTDRRTNTTQCNNSAPGHRSSPKPSVRAGCRPSKAPCKRCPELAWQHKPKPPGVPSVLFPPEWTACSLCGIQECKSELFSRPEWIWSCAGWVMNSCLLFLVCNQAAWFVAGNDVFIILQDHMWMILFFIFRRYSNIIWLVLVSAFLQRDTKWPESHNCVTLGEGPGVNAASTLGDVASV